MVNYQATFEFQRLPLGMDFTQEGIEFLKNDEFVEYYHNYYKEGAHFEDFRKMVDERVHLGQIIRNKSLN